MNPLMQLQEEEIEQKIFFSQKLFIFISWRKKDSFKQWGSNDQDGRHANIW